MLLDTLQPLARDGKIVFPAQRLGGRQTCLVAHTTCTSIRLHHRLQLLGHTPFQAPKLLGVVIIARQAGSGFRLQRLGLRNCNKCFNDLTAVTKHEQFQNNSLLPDC